MTASPSTWQHQFMAARQVVTVKVADARDSGATFCAQCIGGAAQFGIIVAAQTQLDPIGLLRKAARRT
ncbi:MAG: hypothetical protein IPM27_11580 [Nitrosomonadales bacterium]|nr:hypothetical protein [Nitrosomonadales bacterium]